jgi:hypothetical protein
MAMPKADFSEMNTHEERVPDEFMKQRQIVFAEFHPDPDQAGTAVRRLLQTTGVSQAEALQPNLLSVRYDVRCITLEEICADLVEHGLHLSSKMFYKLQRAMYKYAEDTQRANAGCGGSKSNCTKRVFARRYARVGQDCHDKRPDHWRQYL